MIFYEILQYKLNAEKALSFGFYPGGTFAPCPSFGRLCTIAFLIGYC